MIKQLRDFLWEDADFGERFFNIAWFSLVMVAVLTILFFFISSGVSAARKALDSDAISVSERTTTLEWVRIGRNTYRLEDSEQGTICYLAGDSISCVYRGR